MPNMPTIPPTNLSVSPQDDNPLKMLFRQLSGSNNHPPPMSVDPVWPQPPPPHVAAPFPPAQNWMPPVHIFFHFYLFFYCNKVYFTFPIRKIILSIYYPRVFLQVYFYSFRLERFLRFRQVKCRRHCGTFNAKTLRGNSSNSIWYLNFCEHTFYLKNFFVRTFLYAKHVL